MMALTCLLVTGRPSEPLADFLGSSQQTSERVNYQNALGDRNLTPETQGIQKWEMTVVDALVRLRDFSEKRVAPACQRLHLVLEEIQGWSHL
jgi:anaphase-promoting complex subunit 4